jgi:hypothetical protein
MRKTTKIQHCRNRSNEKNNKNTTMSEQIQWEKQQKYNTVGTGPTRNKKYLITISNFIYILKIWAHKTTLTPPPFIEMPVPSQESVSAHVFVC